MPRHPASLFCALITMTFGQVMGQTLLRGPVASDGAFFDASAGAKVASHLSPEAKDLAEQIYRTLAPAHSSTAIGNTALGLWMVGRLQVALHLMGKAVAADPSNIDNQCNYAAMLTMSGGAAQAIPVLEQLAKKYPTNPTVLNNLGQAYYLAGKTEKAGATLTRALAIAPHHPQAAATQSQIAESQGDTAKAVELAKQAVQQSVSLDKLNRLRKLRYKLTLDDLKEGRPAAPDPLGLTNFIHPAFPKNAAEENRTRREWASFYQEIQERIQSLQKKLFELQPPAEAAAKAQAAYANFLNGNMAAGSSAKSEISVHPHARKAKLMLELLNKDSGAKLRLQRAKEALETFVTQKRQLMETDYLAAYNQLLREEANQTGEGLANRDFCPQFVALADKYLAGWSDGREKLYNDYLHQLRLKLGEQIYWQQFLQPQQEFQATLIKTQIEWLAAFAQSGIRSDGTIGVRVNESCLTQKQAPRGGKLANFNDVHCQYHSELKLGIGSIITDCERMTSTLGIGPVQLGLHQDMDQGTDFFDSFVSCNVEVSVGKSAGVELGPINVEVGAEAGMGVEIGRDGVQDVYVTGKVEATVMDVVGSGAEGRMSLISGSSSIDIL